MINQVADEIWECRDGDIHKWEGDILAYKEHLIEHMGDENVNMAQSADNKNIKNEFVKKVVAPAKVSLETDLFKQDEVFYNEQSKYIQI